jgi:hypothetical protein
MLSDSCLAIGAWGLEPNAECAAIAVNAGLCRETGWWGFRPSCLRLGVSGRGTAGVSGRGILTIVGSHSGRLGSRDCRWDHTMRSLSVFGAYAFSFGARFQFWDATMRSHYRRDPAEGISLR